MPGISLLAEELYTSEEGFGSLELNTTADYCGIIF
jgi:hypothetical protein